jgi:integrase
MVTRKVSIWIRYKAEGEWVMKQAQWSANRRHLVPGCAKGSRAAADEYLYYLRFQRDGKRVTEAAGRDSIQAVALATTREIELFTVERRAAAPAAVVAPTNARVTVADAVQAYLRLVAGNTERSTYNAYRNALENFREANPACVYLDQINADVLRAFVGWMRGRKLDQNTVYTRFSEVITFLVTNGIDIKLAKGERPKRRRVSKDGTDIETYSEEDIRKLLAVCRNERERLIVLVATESGMRRGEVAHLEREDILDGQIVVRAQKPKYGFKTKKKKGRTPAVPKWLTDDLKAYVATLPDSQSVLFPSRNGRPSGKALNGLMNRLCKEAGVKVPRTQSGEGQPFHGTRSYAAIKRLREGMTIYEVAEWLGWDDMETMMRYLKKAKSISKESRAVLDATTKPEPMMKETEEDGKAA